jgi:hypothetical protein
LHAAQVVVFDVIRICCHGQSPHRVLDAGSVWRVSGLAWQAGRKRFLVGATVMRYVFVILATLWAGIAQAASIQILDIESGWSNAQTVDVLGGNAELTYVDPNELRWGRSWTGTGPRSGFRFDQLAEGTTQGANQLFDVGRFTHMNRVIFQGQHLDRATLNMRLTASFDGRIETIDTAYVFTLLETPNYAQPCANGERNGVNRVGRFQTGGSTLNRNGCADRVQLLQNPSVPRTFTHNGLEYQFELLGFASGPEFWTVEDLDNPILLQARFNVSGTPIVPPQPPVEPPPIPLPAGAWFMLAGMGALAIMRRRAKRG